MNTCLCSFTYLFLTTAWEAHTQLFLRLKGGEKEKNRKKGFTPYVMDASPNYYKVWLGTGTQCIWQILRDSANSTA